MEIYVNAGILLGYLNFWFIFLFNEWNRKEERFALKTQEVFWKINFRTLAYFFLI